MKGGFYFMHRGWMDNPVFKKEPYTEREAWLWLIENAAWKDERVRIKTIVVDVKRGQVAASGRYMAEAWGWQEPRVRRFLDRLKIDAMIERVGDAGINVVTVCNYDTYQAANCVGDAPIDAPIDAASTQIKKKNNKKKNPPVPPAGGSVDGTASKPAKGERVYSETEAAGIRAIKEAYPQRAGSQGWKDANDRMADIVASGRATWDDLLRITRAHAQQMARGGKVGTEKVPMASTYFGEQKGYWLEELERVRASNSPSNVDHLYRKALIDYRDGKPWDPIFGPLPRTPGCDIPAALIDEIFPQPAARPVLALVNA